MFVARPTEAAGRIASKGWGNSGLLPGNIWVIPADGTKRWLVSNFFFSNLQPPDGRRADPLKLDVTAVSWSPDGGKVAFLAYEGEDGPRGQANLHVMNADATDVYRLIDSQGWGYGNTFQWTEGNGLFVNGRNGFYVQKLDGTMSSPLAIPGGGTLTQPCISPNGSSIAGIIEDAQRWACA